MHIYALDEKKAFCRENRQLFKKVLDRGIPGDL